MLFVNAQWTKSNRYPLNKKISPHHVEQAPDIHNIKCHAPRERVSWNVSDHVSVLVYLGHAPRERVSWNCRLGLSAEFHRRSRSTWACELKSFVLDLLTSATGHAPRERVSWNLMLNFCEKKQYVTLHVSVWVEMTFSAIPQELQKSRSTWACELKCLCCYLFISTLSVTLHVSVWVEMIVIPFMLLFATVTLHVSVWVEIWCIWCCMLFATVTLHVSVWVEIFRPDVIDVFHSVTLHVSVWVEIAKARRKQQERLVTLHVSVWVEITLRWFFLKAPASRSTWACELKCICKCRNCKIL